jgi:hypothetical protein
LYFFNDHVANKPQSVYRQGQCHRNRDFQTIEIAGGAKFAKNSCLPKRSIFATEWMVAGEKQAYLSLRIGRHRIRSSQDFSKGGWGVKFGILLREKRKLRHRKGGGKKRVGEFPRYLPKITSFCDQKQ